MLNVYLLYTYFSYVYNSSTYVSVFAFTVAEDLKLLIIKLLRKTRKNVPMDKWEHAVSKFCFGYSSQDAWEIERFGFKKASLAVKLRVLKVNENVTKLFVNS